MENKNMWAVIMMESLTRIVELDSDHGEQEHVGGDHDGVAD
jgi:hypothetical protein